MSTSGNTNWYEFEPNQFLACFIHEGLTFSLDTSNPATYSLTSRTSLNAHPIQTVSSVRDLGLLLNTGFSVDDNIARATKKARGMLFYLKRSFATLTPSIFRPLCKAFIRPYLEYAIQASSLILSRDCQALESVQKLAVKFVKGSRPGPIWDSSPWAAALFPSPKKNPWWPYLHVQNTCTK